MADEDVRGAATELLGTLDEDDAALTDYRRNLNTNIGAYALPTLQRGQVPAVPDAEFYDGTVRRYEGRDLSRAQARNPGKRGVRNREQALVIEAAGFAGVML